MGKKKPGVAASSKEDQQQAPKGKKKNMKIDDDEYEMVESVDVVADEIEAMSLKTKEDDASTLFSGKKKPSKKGKKSKEEEEEDDDDNKSDLVGMNSVEEDLGEGKKGKKKGKGGKPKSNDMLAEMDDPDEGPKEDDEAEEDNTVFAGKKKSKGKKGKKDTTDKFSILAQLEAPDGDAPEEEQEAPSIVLAGKKKGKGKKGRHDDFDDDFAIVPDVEQDAVEEPTDIVFTGKKKTKGKKSVQFSALEDLEDGNNDASSLEDENEIVFAGKKSKGKKGGKVEENLPSSKFALLDDEDEHISEDPEEFVFSGKKKSKSKKGGKGKHEESVPQSKFSILSDEDMVDGKEDDEADEEIVFSGKKKSKGKKNKQDDVPVSTVSSSVVVSEKDAEEVESGVTTGASKKQKKKNKKSVRTPQEEDDLERILAELGEGLAQPSTSKAAAVLPEEASTSAPAASTSEQAEQEDNAPAESAAAKKKKKKKEKEKEKKAAASAEIKEDEKVEEPKGKAADKKLPKHVREMQERLAKVREAEEKKRQEEEEKLRKEEEERLRLEEIERQKEEARRRKKEREKEKLLKKKQEGKLLTGKKKEEAKRLTMMREQFLAQSALSTDVLKEDHGAPKKPKYDTKKKRHSPAVAEQLASSKEEVLPTKEEDEVGPELETGIVEEQPTAEMEEKQEEEEEEEEDDWDAKSWDEKDVVLRTKSAFDEDEEEETVPTKNPRKNGPVQHANGAPLTSKQPAQPSNKPQNEDEDSEDADSDSEAEGADSKKRSDTSLKRDARKADAISKRSSEDLRSPICCILGHVDTGKTKLLDCIRRTNVQEGEAGGITQQIGATYFPMENIRERTKELKPDANLRVPGLLVIDTPGHEAFNNLRARGSSSCDIAILVVDIMHGLEPQTIESLNLLKARHTPFVVALNKVDRLYGWKSRPNAPIKLALKNQTKDVQAEFESRLQEAIQSLQAQGMNSELYYRNKDVRKYVSIVPTSAISGEGVPDLLLLLIQMTQKMMEEKLMYISEVQCTVLEVKVIEGLGTTIDVILINGVLHEGDQIVVCGMQGPIVTSIRALLTPHPMKEIRVKGSYLHHKELKAAQGIKIVGQGLEHAIAGTQLYIVGPDDDLEDMKREAMEDIETVMSRIDKTGEGVCVQASTLGSLEALLEFLKTPAVNIPVSGISIGPVHKKDIMKASVMLEKKKKEYAAILAFDVKVTPDARELAEELGVKIFMADIIYHLFDQFKAYVDNIKEEKKKEAAEEAVFPCVLKILPNCVFNKKDPIIVGVDILEGIARVGTQLCVPSQEFIDIGKIASIEINHKAVNVARKGQQVAMKIAAVSAEEAQKMVGRHFDVEDELVSHVTRRSIDILKENYRDDLSNEEWKLVVKLKKLFKIA